MSFVDISEQPLAVNLVYYSRLGPGTHTTSSIQQVEPFVPGLSATLAPLTPYLTQSLAITFDQLWGSVYQTETASVVSQFYKQAAAAGRSVNSVVATLPQNGALTAEVLPAQIAPGGAVLVQPQLIFNFSLPGCDVSFDTGSVTAEWDVSFDALLALTITVPEQPFNLQAAANVSLSNASLSADNALAWWEGAFANFFNFITFGAVSTPYDGVESGVDGVNQPTNALGLGGLITTLNNAGPKVTAAGFTQCAFSITAQNQLVLTLTHPLDPAPTVENVNDLGHKILTNPPSLAVTDDQVTAGQAITVFGANFPVETVDQAMIQWNNTSSGAPTDGQYEYRQAGGATQGPVEVYPGAGFDNEYSATVSGLAANTHYQFRARCGDQPTYSQWSGWLDISTAPGKHVELVLKSAAAANAPAVVVGGGDLSATSTAWQTPATIPSGTALGAYDLIAKLNGKELASTPITVVEFVVQRIELIDPTTQAVLQPQLIGGAIFTIRCEGFPIGPMSVTVAGTVAATPYNATGDFTQTLTAPGTPEGDAFAFQVVVTAADGQHASLTIQVIGAPK